MAIYRSPHSLSNEELENQIFWYRGVRQLFKTIRNVLSIALGLLCGVAVGPMIGGKVYLLPTILLGAFCVILLILHTRTKIWYIRSEITLPILNKEFARRNLEA